MRIVIEFEPAGRRLEAETGQTVMEAARGLVGRDTGGISAPCGGRGLCGRCKVRLVEGGLSPPSETEKRLLGEDAVNEGYRLACQAVIAGPVKIEVPAETLAGGQSLQLEGHGAVAVPEPAVKRHVVPLKATTVDHPFSLWQQVELFLAAAGESPGLRIDGDLLGSTDPLARDEQIVVTRRGKEIINAVRGGGASKSAGFAVDLGTTKIAGFLVDLETGETLAADGLLNPQIAYGEDVISRLVYALEGEEQYGRIRRAVRDGLGRLLKSLCAAASVRPQDVEEAVIAGNTAMHHLLLGLPVAQLARSPYVPATTLPVEVKGRTLGLDMAPGAVAYLLPAVAGYVGGDHVAMVLNSRIDEAAGLTLGLDIGTNTEIVLAGGGSLISCSCASGPAFEGAHVQQGMRAVDGAVYEVTLADGGRRAQYQTIGGKPPLGFCGSGVLDAVAELYRTGVVS
ncbi:MAG: ASKHA domain-containing protein, partial [Peptococcaceae bacterium]|nr:ASKHA domain-containing protein [Peptococcaceae bacterium]